MLRLAGIQASTPSCFQVTPAPTTVEKACGPLHTNIIANDLVFKAGEDFELITVTSDALILSGRDINSVDFFFYTNINGQGPPIGNPHSFYVGFFRGKLLQAGFNKKETI